MKLDEEPANRIPTSIVYLISVTNALALRQKQFRFAFKKQEKDKKRNKVTIQWRSDKGSDSRWPAKPFNYEAAAVAARRRNCPDVQICNQKVLSEPEPRKVTTIYCWQVVTF